MRSCNLAVCGKAVGTRQGLTTCAEGRIEIRQVAACGHFDERRKEVPVRSPVVTTLIFLARSTRCTPVHSCLALALHMPNGMPGMMGGKGGNSGDSLFRSLIFEACGGGQRSKVRIAVPSRKTRAPPKPQRHPTPPGSPSYGTRPRGVPSHGVHPQPTPH